MEKQKIGLRRNITDKFYTKPDIVKFCSELIDKYIKIDKENDLIIEPSAGDGAFIDEIKIKTKNYKFYDLQPENELIIKQDFLELNIKKIDKYKTIHIIGNPPFGRQSSTAIKFIKKSCDFSNSISFILPKSFKKQSMKKHFNCYFHLICEIDLPENSFLVNKKEYNVPCIFQIWKKDIVKRILYIELKPKNFIFVKKNESPDISFRRVGINAGKISLDIESKNTQSHYFIKFINIKNLKKIISKLQNIKFEFNNTVGPKSISKQELIEKFNEIIN